MLSFTRKIPKELQSLFYRKDAERLLRSNGFSRSEAKRKAYLLKSLGLTKTDYRGENE